MIDKRELNKHLILDKKSKKIAIIGNGFDLYHGLKTRYSDFKKYVYEINPKLVEYVNEIFWNQGYKKDDLEYWSELEVMLGSLPELDYDALYEDAFDGAETDMDRASYWHDPEYNAQKKAEEELLVPLKLKSYFDEWVNSINLKRICRKPWLEIYNFDLFINFNYTDTLQEVYGISNAIIFHIHGDANSSYVLGHNEIEKLPYPDPYETYFDPRTGETTSDADVRQAQVRESLNSTYTNLFKAYFKNSIKIIAENQKWFNQFESATRVTFMGLSMGLQDEIYIKEIDKLLPKTTEIIVYWHENKEEMVKKCESLLCGRAIKYEKW